MGPSNGCYLSDSTGNLARHLLGAVLTQFPPGSVTTKSESFVRTHQHLDEVLARALAERAAVCHAMVSADFKQKIDRFCRENGLHCCDLTGPTVDFLTGVTGAAPKPDLAVLHKLDEAYRRRIGAIEFAMAHDDGLGLDTLHEADVVLVGVSRTSKTPTTIYLAQHGYRAGNVALALGIDPPAELMAMPPKKVVGLLVDPQQLCLVRHHRQEAWQLGRSTYGDADYVTREIAWTRNLFNKAGWHAIDVTDHAIEETAARIAQLIGPARAPLPADDETSQLG